MGTKNTVAQHNTEVAFKALEGLALACDFIGQLYERLPEGEERDVCEKVGLALIDGGEQLLDALVDPDEVEDVSSEDVSSEDVSSEDVSSEDVSSEDGVDAEVLRNEVVSFAGAALFAMQVFAAIRDDSTEVASRNTAEAAIEMLGRVFGSLPETDDDGRADEARALSDELWDDAYDYCVENFGEDGDAEADLAA